MVNGKPAAERHLGAVHQPGIRRVGLRPQGAVRLADHRRRLWSCSPSSAWRLRSTARTTGGLHPSRPRLALIVAGPGRGSCSPCWSVTKLRRDQGPVPAGVMKIAAAEAQWTTCQPCGFSLFQSAVPGRRQTPTSRSRFRSCSRYMATGPLDGQVLGMNALKQQEQRKYGRGDYMPNVRVIYWAMRVMAYPGRAVVPGHRRVGAVADPAENAGHLPRECGSCGWRSWGSRCCRSLMNHGGLVPDRERPPAVDRAGASC